MKHYWFTSQGCHELTRAGMQKGCQCKELEPEDIIAMQTIDADCNDCRHYKREKNFSNYSIGHCLKFDKPTKGYPNYWTGHECFEHRRAPV